MIITDSASLILPCEDSNLFEGQQIIQQLEEELVNSSKPGIGLAANQIGIQKRICIVRIDQNTKLDFINPVITHQYDPGIFKNEGCLSYPGQTISTLRFGEIVVTDLLHPAGLILTGLEAIVTQHEILHTLGKTMFDFEVDPKRPNSKCICGSGRKIKRCCGGKEIKLR